MLHRSVIVTGPVAQPGRVPDFYLKEEIRLSRVRIPTGPHVFSFESILSQFLETQNWEKAVERLQKFWTDQLAVKDIPGFELYPFTVFLSGD